MTDKGNSINIDGHECYGFGDPYFLNTGVFTGELKNGYIIHANVFCKGNNHFDMLDATIDNHVGDKVEGPGITNV